MSAEFQNVLDTVAQQAEDEGLWFIAATAPEGYLQSELRRLHAAVEACDPPSRREELAITPEMIEAGIETLRDHETFIGNLGPSMEENLVQEILEACLKVV